MLKYYVAATFIVLSVAVFATAWRTLSVAKIDIASTAVPAPPKPYHDASSGPRKDRAFIGVAPWALSVLPDCFEQQEQANGRLAYVRSKIPAGASEVAAGTQLHFGHCTIWMRSGDAVVFRGADRMLIPAHVTIYTAGKLIVVLRTTGNTGELRTYTLSNN